MRSKGFGNIKYRSMSIKSFDNLYKLGWRFLKINSKTGDKYKIYTLFKNNNGNKSLMSCISVQSTVKYIIEKSKV